jgi:hypothetical protein
VVVEGCYEVRHQPRHQSTLYQSTLSPPSQHWRRSASAVAAVVVVVVLVVLVVLVALLVVVLAVRRRIYQWWWRIFRPILYSPPSPVAPPSAHPSARAE